MRNVRNGIALKLAVAFCLAMPALAHAAPPQWNFRGRYDAQGEAVADGFHPVTLKLYVSPTGGSPLWTVSKIVPIEDGFVNAELDAPIVNGVDVLAQNESLWMELVTAEGTYPTRVRIASAPYARHAGDCQSVGGYTADQLRAGSGDNNEDVAALRAQLNQLQTALAQVQSQVATLTAASGNAVTKQSLDQELDSRQVMRRAPAGDPLAPVTRQEMTAALSQYVTTQALVATVTQTVDGSVAQRIPTRIEPNAVAVANGLGRSTTVSIDAAGAPTEVTFSGVNLRITNGVGMTKCPTNQLGVRECNGRGNLFIGYNHTVFNSPVRSGSHNLVIGDGHEYTSYGGLVTGQKNTISGPYAAVVGGESNTASATGSVVTGGMSNQATQQYASVSGGNSNIASGWYASVSGGLRNNGNGSYSSISGGSDNQAPGIAASVAGGTGNKASAESSSILGGQSGEAVGKYAAVAGGFSGKASGVHSVLVGGNNAEASAQWSTERDLPIRRSGSDLIVEGVNLVVRDGSGNTACTDDDDDECSGLGNIIIGYNDGATVKTGQHNLIVGTKNHYSSYGGIVSGQQNTVAGPYATALGGYLNVANGQNNTIVGGQRNSVHGKYHLIAGGRGNKFNWLGQSPNLDGDQTSVIVGGLSNEFVPNGTHYNVTVGGRASTTVLSRENVIVGGKDIEANFSNATVNKAVLGTGVAGGRWTPPAN